MRSGSCSRNAGVLETEHDPDFVFALGTDEVGMLADDEECFGMLFDERFNVGDIFDGVFEFKLGDGEINGGDAGLPDRSEEVGGGRHFHFEEWSAEGVDDYGVFVEGGDGRRGSVG